MAYPFTHRSVLLQEALAQLGPRSGGVYCDATLGAGGHSEAILHASAPDGRVLGVDRDPQALAAATERLRPFGDRFTPLHGRFGDLPALLAGAGAPAVDGILADVGVSSPQIDQPERGFSFQHAGPIDMRMDPSSGESALDLVGRLSEDALADILHGYGEERFARRIARALKAARDADLLTDTVAMQRIIARAVPTREPGKDPATRTFQALRIAVNDELRELDRLLRLGPSCLRPGGRLVLITFHSLEDRLVKRRLQEHAQAGTLTPCLRKPLEAAEGERADNPRARSARLRAAVLP